MGATFVGTAINSKVLKSTSQNIETNGLVTLEETYTVKTSSAQSIIPRTDTTHASFSSATTKYTNMLVESTSLKEEVGGLSTLVVNYAGLLSSVLPKPIIRSIPIAPTFRGSPKSIIIYGQGAPFQDAENDFRAIGPDGSSYLVMTEEGPELQIEFVTPSNSNTTRGFLTRTNLAGNTVVGSTLPRQINNFPISGAGNPIIDSTSGSVFMGYVLMNEETAKRGGCIIVVQIYRKVSLSILYGGRSPLGRTYLDPWIGQIDFGLRSAPRG